jgi:hypothetical protein
MPSPAVTTTSTPAESVTCVLCGHAVPGGPYHERCAARVRQVTAILVSAGLDPEQAERALQAHELGAVIPAGVEGVFLVVASSGDGPYVTGANFCSCPAATAHCYHKIAVIILSAASQHP